MEKYSLSFYFFKVLQSGQENKPNLVFSHAIKKKKTNHSQNLAYMVTLNMEKRGTELVFSSFKCFHLQKNEVLTGAVVHLLMRSLH